MMYVVEGMLQLKSCYTLRFDKVELDPEAFHAAQMLGEKIVENIYGVRCKRVVRSISSIGLYVPGGTAILPSTALMLAIPAQIAGCKTVVLATPPARDGSVCKEVLYCAKKAGVTHIPKAGGAQAISAMACGTQSCPKGKCQDLLAERSNDEDAMSSTELRRLESTILREVQGPEHRGRVRGAGRGSTPSIWYGSERCGTSNEIASLKTQIEVLEQREAERDARDTERELKMKRMEHMLELIMRDRR